MAESSRRFSIGYALAPKKQQSFMQPSLVNLAKERGIDLIKIDKETLLIEQGPFDFVLHKFYGDDWKKELADYKAKNPSVVIVDSPEATERLHNRISMLQAVSEIQIAQPETDSTFGIPNQTVIYDAEALRNPRSWEALKFPVIAKPLVADGSAKSHKMTLVYNQEVLTSLKPPIVLQEFVNHGGVIFKVYVAGEHVKCVKRKSLPDVAEDKLGSMGDVLTFSQVSNLGGPSEQTDDRYYKKMKLDDYEMPPEALISDIARGLGKALKLNLFNFDVIRDTSVGNRYLVIDINYFPGFSKMPNYEAVLTDFFCDLVAKKQEELAEESSGSEMKTDES